MNRGNSESVSLVSVGLPSRETARGFCSARKYFTCSSSGWKRTPLWVGVVGALLEELELTPLVLTVREPREPVFFNLSDGFSGPPDFFLGNGGVGALCATTAGRASACDSDKSRDRVTPGVGVEWALKLKPAVAGRGVMAEVELEFEGVSVVGKGRAV